MTPLQRTIRVLLGHARSLGEVGRSLLLSLEAYGHDYGSWAGGVNSWYVNVPDEPCRFLWGNLDNGTVEVRLTTRRRGRPALLVLNNAAQAERWVRMGCPL